MQDDKAPTLPAPPTPPEMGMKQPSLRRNFTWTFVANVVYAACQWGMLMALAKLGNPGVVGRFSLGLSLTAPVIMFTNLRLRTLQATDARRDYAFGDYLALRTIGVSIAFLVILGIALFSPYSAEARIVIVLIGLAKCFESVSDVFYGILLQHERLDIIAISFIYKGVASLIVFSLLFALTRNLVVASAGLAAVWAMVFLTFDVRRVIQMSREGHFGDLISRWWTNSPRGLMKLTWTALPLGLVTTLSSLTFNVPRLAVEHYMGESALGIFSALSYIQVAGSTVTRAFSVSASPRMARHVLHGELDQFKRLVLKLIGVCALIGLIGILAAAVAGRPILNILYRAEYANHVSLFVLVMVSSLFFYISTPMFDVFTAARLINIQLVVSLLMLGITTLGCILWVPRFGLPGALVATIIANIVGTALILVVLIRAMRPDRVRARLGAPERVPQE